MVTKPSLGKKGKADGRRGVVCHRSSREIDIKKPAERRSFREADYGREGGKEKRS